MNEPTTQTGRADHDRAWAAFTETHELAINSHQWERNGCRACERLAAIEVEAIDHHSYRDRKTCAVCISAAPRAVTDWLASEERVLELTNALFHATARPATDPSDLPDGWRIELARTILAALRAGREP